MFTKADLSEGFMQCELDDKSSLLTTFNSPWGRWRYKRMPYGISPAPEIFQQKLNQCLDGLKSIHIIADDILITGRGDTSAAATVDHDRNLRAFLKRCRKMHITLNKDKFEFKLTSLADTLSRAFIQNVDQSAAEQELESVHIAEDIAVSEKQLKDIQMATANDPTILRVIELIESGWPESKKDAPPEVQPYFYFKHELTVQDGIVFKADRCVVPKSARRAVYKELHIAHLGLESTLRARECVFWPGMTAALKDYLSKCEICAAFQNEQTKEPLINHELPNRPWENIGIDFMTVDGQDYLITVDYYSDYFELDRMTSKDASAVTNRLKRHFSRHGVPIIVQSDNGPPFHSSAFTCFANEYNFTTSTSSPEYPQSNGKVESAVKIAKKLVRTTNKDHKDIYRALLAWRNTPTAGLESSPAQRLFGRRTRTLLPTKSSTLKPKITRGVKENKQRKQQQQKKIFDRKTKPLTPLKENDIVRLKPRGNKKIWRKARILEKVNIRSYRIQTEDGTEYVRNRRHLRSTKEPFTPTPPPLEYNAPHFNERLTKTMQGADCANQPGGHRKPTTQFSENKDKPRRSNRVKKKPMYLKDYI